MAERIRRNFTAVILVLAMLTSHIPMLSITANAVYERSVVDESADFETDAIKSIKPAEVTDMMVTYAGGTGFAPVAGFKNALNFNSNTKKRVDIPFNNSTKLGGKYDFTVSMWAFPTANSPYQTLYRQYKTDGGALGVWLRYIRDNGGYLYFGFDVFGDNAAGWQWPWAWNNGVPPADTVKIPVNQWFHVAMTKSGKTVTVYLNGVKYYQMVLDDAHYNAPAPTGATISVGGEDITNQYFDGRIDEVRFWNTALSQSEIEAWMFREIDSKHPRYGSLVFYYKLNQSGGTTVIDSKGSSHGTTVNMADTDWVTSDVRMWTVKAGSSVNGQLIGSDADGSSTSGFDWNLSFEIVTQPSKGTAVITKDNRFTYTADIDKQGIDTFTYKVKDSAGNYSNIQVQSINILPAIFMVTFVTSGGSYVADQSVVYGEKVIVPANPTKIGYTFAGWYKEPSLTNAWVFAIDTVKADTVLYAKWKIDTAISVDVTWGSMEFTYSDGTWNPETHEYEGAGWTTPENANKISVTSTSNVPVTVSYSYERETGYEAVNGNITDGTSSVTSKNLPVGDTTPQGYDVYLSLSGKPPECNISKIGSVTVTIAG
ncbi:MAG: InlB B-repeat-containing protein [Oscillospiraceae bacterium]|nr:InlB B-repeat-containing protein [Oscillospiraceae bacterium]